MQKMKLLACRSNEPLATKIASELHMDLTPIRIKDFPDTEIHVQLDDSVRGSHVFIIQSTSPPVNTNLMELLICADACRRASASHITAVVPYFGYGRQDHKTTGREPITAKLVADLMSTAGVDRIVSVDLHSSQIQGFFNQPMDHLTATSVLISFLKGRDLSNHVVVSPDVGRAKHCEKFTDLLGLKFVLAHKRRIGAKVKVVEIVGDVKGKTPILVDDLIASGSISNTVFALEELGASPAIVVATHPVFVDSFKDALFSYSSFIKEVIVTDTIEIPEEKRHLNLSIVSVSSMLAEVIRRIYKDQSVSQVYWDQNIHFPV